MIRLVYAHTIETAPEIASLISKDNGFTRWFFTTYLWCLVSGFINLRESASIFVRRWSLHEDVKVFINYMHTHSQTYSQPSRGASLARKDKAVWTLITRGKMIEIMNARIDKGNGSYRNLLVHVDAGVLGSKALEGKQKRPESFEAFPS